VSEHVVIVHVGLVRIVTTGRGLARSATTPTTAVPQKPVTNLSEYVFVFSVETFFLDHGLLDFQPMDSFFKTGWIAAMVSAGHWYTTISVIYHCHAQKIGSVGSGRNVLLTPRFISPVGLEVS